MTPSPGQPACRPARSPVAIAVKALGRMLVASGLVVAMLPTAGLASEPPGGRADPSQVLVREESGWTPGNAGMALWFWPEGRRIYQLDQPSVDFSILNAYESNTMEQVETTTLNPPAWSVSWHSEYTSSTGRHHVAAVDREQGRVFVAYRSAVAEGGGPTIFTPTVTRGELCTGSATLADPGCVGGIHVLDGASLESLGLIPMSPPTAEGPRLQPIPRALEYAPAHPEMGWGGRVLMVVEEIANGPTENSIVPALVAATQNAVPRRNSGNIAYAIAFDPDTMRQEWAVRLEGCRNSREKRNWMKAPEGHPSTIFRVGGDDPAVYVGCHGNPSAQGVVVKLPLDAAGFPANLPVHVGDPAEELAEPEPAPDGIVAPAPRQQTTAGPDNVTAIMSDPVSRRILMRVNDAGEVWWVFDTRAGQFIGTIGIGDYNHGHTTFGLDPETGRLYVLAAKAKDTTGPGGLYAADTRRNPVPQALYYPDFADPPRTGVGLNSGGGGSDVGRAMSVEPRFRNGAARLFQTKTTRDGGSFRVLVDRSPVSMDGTGEGPEAVRTLDLDEAVGVTQATFDGAARGFGFRTILIGGLEGAARAGPADPLGLVRGTREFSTSTTTATGAGSFVVQDYVDAAMRPVPPPDPCSNAQRELIVAFVGPQGPAVVDASSARGAAQPILADTRTQEDVGHPATRCGPQDWEGLWQTALVSRPPMEEPSTAWPFQDGTSSCTATDEQQQDSWSDPVVGMFSSRVECGEDQVGGWGQARGVDLDGLSVADTLSSFRIYRDAERGMVARVESIARGIDLGGVVKIDTIRGVAESWANGRHAPEHDAEASDGSEPGAETQDDATTNPFNCDMSRPAGTCFERHVFGVTVADPHGGVAYRCGPCGPEDDFLDAMNRAFGAYGYARFRGPDPRLARGSDDGYIAAVTKPDSERFADVVLNNDLLETMVPMLEVVRYAPHNRPNSQNIPAYEFGTPPRGRQLFQFAAVEVSSTYSIQCLLHYDAATNTCSERPVELGSLTVHLADGQGTPLAGGSFEVRRDVDADGIIGLVDELLTDGACVTAADGTGTCTFDGLEPAGYLVSQTAAPPGYSLVTEPWATELAPGEARTVTFTNAPNVSTVEMTATDHDGNPVEGATFAVYADPDADGKIAPGAQPVATCTTDASGACAMTVPTGSYVLVQTAAPAGMDPVEPVAFAFASGGQTAAVGVVNQPVGGETTAAETAPAPVQVGYSPPVSSPPTEAVAGYTPSDSIAAPEVSVPDRVGGTVVRVIRAPGDAVRLLSRDPLQASAWTTALALFALALLAVRRRHLLSTLTMQPAFAFTRAGAPPPLPPVPPAGAPGATGAIGTAVRERPMAGGAPTPTESINATVVVASASPVLAALVTGRLAGADDIQLLAAVDSLEQLRVLLTDRRPDVLVIDLGLPSGSPQAVCRLVAELHHTDGIVALIPGDVALEAVATAAAAAGFAGVLAVDGDIGNGHLAYTVRQVAAGNPCYGPTVQAVVLQRGDPAELRGKALTAREREVAQLAAAGIPRSRIARQLHVSPSTVKRHLYVLRRKLGVTDASDLVELRSRLVDAGVLENLPRPDIAWPDPDVPWPEAGR